MADTEKTTDIQISAPPIRVPMIALRGIVLLPGTISHFDLNRQKSILASEAAIRTKREIFLTAQKDSAVVDPSADDLYRRGVTARVIQLIKMQNDTVRVLADIKSRADLIELRDEGGYLEADIYLTAEDEDGLLPEEEEAMAQGLLDALGEYGKENKKLGLELKKKAEKIHGADALIYLIVQALPMPYQRRQKILETDGRMERCELLLDILLEETRIASIKNEIQGKVKSRIDKNQRDYILREQLKVIREELGESSPLADAEEFKKALRELDAPEYVKKRIEKEIKRLEHVSGNPSESSVSRSYIEVLLDFPWSKRTDDHLDLSIAQKILDEDHYGLDEIKERVIEYLAVRALRGGAGSHILCFVGPPGTGKTSVARSIAASLGRKYVRISLGGVRDEAEIRGHRRTYIGAMPGRIVQGMRQAGVKNPLILLDEIDKMSRDYRGDTASAMMEVLDAEQNVKFFDHYMDVPADLSEVIFIATANDMQAIPTPLIDRMEVVKLSGYSEDEKLHIAKEHLVEKKSAECGLEENEIYITDEAIELLIREHTKEAGVRSLERKIAGVCRKAAREIYAERQQMLSDKADENPRKIVVTSENLEHYAGRAKYRRENICREDEIGIAHGLAWTSAGGVVLEIEVNIMRGEGRVSLTGQMGDVMKESAGAGISYIRSVGAEYDIDDEFFARHDIHIHIPEGAIPKDGPSAGITMAAAILSAATGRQIRAEIAMTGEITLRGRILPVGGLKEKLLAARAAGFTAVCVPGENRPDIEEFPPGIREGLEICYVSHMDEVIEKIFKKKEPEDEQYSVCSGYEESAESVGESVPS